MTRNGATFTLALLVGLWGCTPASEQKESNPSGKQGSTEVTTTKGDPQAPKSLTLDEFGRQLFAVLKNKDYDIAKGYLLSEQDGLYLYTVGVRIPKLEQDELWKRLQEDITEVHEFHFKIGARTNLDSPIIQTVEYVRFVPGEMVQGPGYAFYENSSLVIKLNGKLEQHLEIDKIMVIKGVWRIFELS